MEGFAKDSAFAQDQRAQYVASMTASTSRPSAPPQSLDLIFIDRSEVEGMYNEANDLVRSLGTATSTGGQKKSSSDFNIGELHDRLTDLRDSLYRYLP